MSVTNQSGNEITRWFQRLWETLTQPNAAIQDPAARRRARLLAALSLLLFVLNLVGLLAAPRDFRNTSDLSSFYGLVGLGLVSLLVYGLSRTRFFQVAIILLMTTLSLVGYAQAMAGDPDPRAFTLTILPLSFLLAMGLLSMRGVLALTLVNLLIPWLLMVLMPHIQWSYAVTMIGQVSIYAVLVAVVIFTRDTIERARLKELKQVNQELQDLSTGLELRISERTRDIALAAEIGRRIALVHDVSDLLAEAVRLIGDRFDLYYTQVYLVDSAGRSLVLRAGTGDVGQDLLRTGHRLPLDLTSINGTAALEKRIVVVSNTARSLVFRPHPRLPETRSEMAVPLISAGRVLGVLDLQSSRPGDLTEENLPVFETLAGQLTAALVNADLFEQARRALSTAEIHARAAARQGWTSYMDAIEVKERLAYGYENHKLQPLPEVALDITPDPRRLTTPITVSGQPVGALQFELDRAWSQEEAEMVSTVAQQVAQQVENLRLLGQAARFQQEAEDTVGRLTNRQWGDYLKLAQVGQLGYVYDQQQVQPLRPGQDGQQAPVEIDIAVNSRPIGRIGLPGLEQLSEEDAELVTAISEQLGAHLEGLRLYSSAQMELEERRRTEQVLESQRRTLQAVLDNMPAGVYMVEAPSGRPMLANKQAEAFLGRGISPDAFGDELNQIYQAYRYGSDDLYPPQEMPVVAGMFGQAKVVDDMEVRRPDGSRVLLQVNGAPVLDAAGQVMASVVVFQDITEARRTQEMIAKRATELVMVSQISTTVATIADPNQMLQTVVNLVKQAFDLYHAHVYLLEENGEALQLACGAGEIGRQMILEGRRIPINAEKSLVARAARTRRGVMVNDTRADPEFLPHALLPDTRSEMAVPMIAGDRLLGVLDIQSTQPFRFTEDDVSIQTTLSSQVAVGLQNARQYTQTQESERLIRTVIDSTPDWIYIKDQQQRYRLVNKGYADALHRAPEDFIGRDDLELGFPEVLVKGDPNQGIDGFWTHDRAVMESGEPRVFPNDVATIDGALHTFHTIKTPLRDANGQVWGVLAFCRDVTEREKTLAETEALYQATSHLAGCHTYADVLDALVASSLLKDFDQAALYFFNRPWRVTNPPDHAQFISVWQRQPGASVFEEGQALALDQLPLVEPMRRLSHLVIADARSDDGLPEDLRAWLLQSGGVASIHYRLMAGEEWIGSLFATSAQPRTIDEGDIRRLSILVEQAGTVIQSLRLFEQVQNALRETAVLYTASRSLNESTTFQDMIAAVMQGVRVPDVNRAILVRFGWNEQEQVESAEVVASWYSGFGAPMLPPVGAQLPPDAFDEMSVLRTMEPILVNDPENDPRLTPPAIEMRRAMRVGADATLPLWASGRQIGFLALQSEAPHHFTDPEIRAFLALAGQMAVAVESRRLFEEVQARARREQMLREITARVRGSMDPDVILRTAVRELGTALGRSVFVRVGSADQLVHKPGQPEEPLPLAAAPNGQKPEGGK